MYSTSLGLREMQIKAKNERSLTKIANTSMANNTRCCGEDVEQPEIS